MKSTYATITRHHGILDAPSGPIRFGTYPGGEVRVNVDDYVRRWYLAPAPITARLQTPEDIMRLVMFSETISADQRARNELRIPYFPYARQDRDDGIHGNSLRAFCRIIAGLGYQSIWTMDPHSDVLPALLPNLTFTSGWKIARTIPKLNLEMDADNTAIVAPDAGAAKKLAGVVGERRLIIAHKTRNPSDGTLSNFLVAEQCPETCIIVDDICDGGRTFIGLAKALRAQGAKRVLLYVTHGIFSAGLDVFNGLIDHVYTTDSFVSGQTDSDFLTIQEFISDNLSA